MARGKVKELFLCVISLWNLCTATGDFYSFGGPDDNTLPNTNSDGGTALALDIEFPYYGSSSTNIYINIDGTLSLWGEQKSFKYVPIPAMKTSAVIAPLCTDMDTTTGNGAVFYRQSTDPALLTSISMEINNHYGGTFQATWAFVGTWDQVEADSSNTVGIFSFQVVLATDGQTSYTLFIYGSLTESSSQKADIQTGFTAGDGSRYFQMPFTLSELQTLGTISPGRWINKIDEFRILDDTLCGVGGGCPPNHMSSQGCTGNVLVTPALSPCSPELIGPHLNGGYIEFICRVTLETDPQANWLGLVPKAKVTFFFDDDQAFPSSTVSAGTTDVTLQEFFLNDKFGKSLSCQVYTYYDSTPGTASSLIRTTPYWIGVKATLDEVHINTYQDEPVTLSIFATLPVACITDIFGEQMCDVPIRIRSSKPDTAIFLIHGDPTNTEGKYYLKSGDWDEEKKMVMSSTQKVYIRMYPREPGPHRDIADVALEIHPDYDNLRSQDTDHTPIWLSLYSTFPVEVMGDGTGFGMCYFFTDPHIDSFDTDRSYHSTITEDEYMALRSKSPRKLEVLIKQRKTPRWPTAASVCGVIIREANVAYLLSRCNGPLEYYRKSEHELPYTPFSKSGNNWRITMPSGAYVQVLVNDDYFNLYIYVPWRDWEQTEGLCGTYDGDGDNEHIRRGNTIHDTWTYWPQEFIDSWKLTPEENLFNICVMSEDTSIPHEFQEDDYCSLHSDDMTGAGCGWKALKDTIKDGAGFTLVEPQLSPCAINSQLSDIKPVYDLKPIMVSSPYLGSLQNASDHCTAKVEASPSFGPCSDRLNASAIERVVLVCAEDISLTGDLTCADDIISVFQQVCADDVYVDPGVATIDEIISEARNLTANLCPNDCSGQGTCDAGICQCNAGFMGFNCSLPENAVPDLQSMLDPGICDIKTARCSNSHIIAWNVANKDTLTCSMSIEQVNGNSMSYTVPGIQFTLKEVHCPLPHPSDLNTSISAWPAYKYYDVKVSNNGIDYSNVLTQSYVVYDSECLQCDHQANCIRKENTCMIQTRCYGQYQMNPDDVCLSCDPGRSDDSWSSVEGNQAPHILYSLIHRQNGTSKTIRKVAIDPENQQLTHILEDPASHPDVQLFPNGTLIWSTGPGEVSQTISITATDECGQSATADIDLQLICPQSMCSYHGLCLYDVGMSVCVCNQYYTGEVCEREIPAGEWSNWTDTGCSKDCDYGVLTKSRECFREPCSGEPAEVLVCNLFSCQENPVEEDEGVNVTVHQSSIYEFALSADALIEAINGEVDIYCEIHPADCCNSFGVGTVDDTQWTIDVLGRTGAVYIAQSYPRQTAENEDTKAKIIVGIDSSTLSELCGGVRNMHRVVRQAEGMEVHYMDGSILYSALKAGQPQLEQHLDVSLSIDNPSPSSNNNVIIGASIGAAICALTIIVIVVVLHQKGIIRKSSKKPPPTENSVAPVPVMAANSTVNNEADDAGISISVDGIIDKQ